MRNTNNNPNESYNDFTVNLICDFITKQNGQVSAHFVRLILESIWSSYLFNIEEEQNDDINSEIEKYLKFKSDIIKIYEGHKAYSIYDIILILKKAKLSALKNNSSEHLCTYKIDFFIEKLQKLSE